MPTEQSIITFSSRSMINEVWKDIPNYLGRYQASNLGRIKSLVCHRHQDPILSPHVRGGYKEVGLIDSNGRRTCVSIHRLVASAFYGDIPKGMQVNHIDGNKFNNNSSNLEIVTPQENSIHAFRTGLSKPFSNNWDKKVAAIKDGKIERVFNSIRQMCREMNYDRRTIMRCLSGVYGKRYGYTFKLV